MRLVYGLALSTENWERFAILFCRGLGVVPGARSIVGRGKPLLHAPAWMRDYCRGGSTSMAVLVASQPPSRAAVEQRRFLIVLLAPTGSDKGTEL